MVEYWRADYVACKPWNRLDYCLLNFKTEISDPLAHEQFDSTSAKNSVLKFLIDIHAAPETSEFLYTSDRNILIEIILRCLLDLDSDSPDRYEYLSLLRLILTHSAWRETRHKMDQLIR